jgi:kumamolisin
VVTFAAFTPSDIEQYWASLNLVTKPNRLTVVEVDGGSGVPNDILGSDETTLDIDQAGGVAPMADILVYEAPNTAQGLVDVFAKAVEDNIADSISTSFGEWEILETAQGPSFIDGGTATDPFTGETVDTVQATHELFVLAALEGQSLFTAAGDGGAYDTVRIFFTFSDGFANPLAVDYPASDPAITAGGGTTLPGTQVFAGSFAGIDITIPVERVWAWDYLDPACEAIGLSPVDCGFFPLGTGGGVSVVFPVPVTQIGLAGVQSSQPGQVLNVFTIEGDLIYTFDFPAGFAGRNVPDVSFNADPNTGYEFPYTSNFFGFEQLSFAGGTSFVAPQLNGVTALLGQNAGHRFGLFTVPLYLLARTGIATLGPHPALHTLTTGDNWFYTARNGYSPVGGLGTIDVAQLARLLP